MKIEMYTSQVIDTVKKNRADHLEEFEKQMDGWRKAMGKFGKDLKSWSDGKASANKRPLEPTRPQSFEKDYDTLLTELNAHILNNISLEEKDIRKIIHNDFGWNNVFLSNSAAYTGAGPAFSVSNDYFAGYDESDDFEYAEESTADLHHTLVEEDEEESQLWSPITFDTSVPQEDDD